MTYPSTKVKPYVYICYNRITGEFYIGYRKANVIASHLDFPTYQTSSKIVKLNFIDYDWIILAEFNNGDDAYDFEQQLIFENWNDPLLLNKSCYHGKKRFRATKGTGLGKATWNKGKKMWMTKEHYDNCQSGFKRQREENPEKSYRLLKGNIPWNKGKSGYTCVKSASKNHKDAYEKFKRENPEKWAANYKNLKIAGEPKRLLSIQKLTEVNGVTYPSATIAARETGLKKTTLIKRVLSPNYPEYKYLG